MSEVGIELGFNSNPNVRDWPCEVQSTAKAAASPASSDGLTLKRTIPSSSENIFSERDDSVSPFGCSTQTALGRVFIAIREEVCGATVKRSGSLELDSAL